MTAHPAIALLTGWTVNIAALTPLAQALRDRGYPVIGLALPSSEPYTTWLDHLRSVLPERAFWVGWSLGGQLLSALTAHCGERCLGLATLASNPRFSTSASWSTAMENSVFEAFRARYRNAPEATHQRFLQMVAQGSPNRRQLVHHLRRITPFVQTDHAGLAWLAELDTRHTLRTWTGRQLHLFAEDDALVPASCAAVLRAEWPSARIECIPAHGHGFPITASVQAATTIAAFFQANFR